MSTTQPSAAATQEQLLGGIRQGQEALLQAVRTWAGATEKLAGALPSVPARPALPNVGIDFPRPQALVKTSFDFAEKLLAEQRNFTEELIAAAPSFVAKAESSSDSPAAPRARATRAATASTAGRRSRSPRTAKKSTAKKATTKKSTAKSAAATKSAAGREAKA